MRRLLLILFLAVAPAAAEPPRLVVLIVIDQFPASFLDRMPENGVLRDILRASAAYPLAHFDHVPTETAPGHAAIATGVSPAVHGIIGNDIYDRKRRKVGRAIEDPVRGVGPFRLHAPTLADAVRAAYPEARIVAIAGKDRSAILLGGRRPNAALWFSKSVDAFITAPSYGPSPAWIEAVNSAFRLETAPPFSKRDPGASPALDRATLAAGIAAIEGEALGRDEVPDLLMMSFSATDLIGHKWGPDSRQMDAQLPILDGFLGELVAAAEAAAPGRTLFALTSDHGVLPLPGSEAGKRLKARRVSMADFFARIEGRLQEARPVPGKKWLLRLDVPDVYLNRDMPGAASDFARWVRQAASIIAGEPEVAAAYVPGQNRDTDDFSEIYRRSYSPGQSGDLQIRLVPGLLLSRWPGGTSHGSPYPYDSHVPLLLWGAGVKPGRSKDPVSVESLAPTLAEALGVDLPPGDARVLVEALEPAPERN